jgi:hypothetical protein
MLPHVQQVHAAVPKCTKMDKYIRLSNLPLIIFLEGYSFETPRVSALHETHGAFIIEVPFKFWSCTQQSATLWAWVKARFAKRCVMKGLLNYVITAILTNLNGAFWSVLCRQRNLELLSRGNIMWNLQAHCAKFSIQHQYVTRGYDCGVIALAWLSALCCHHLSVFDVWAGYNVAPSNVWEL